MFHEAKDKKSQNVVNTSYTMTRSYEQNYINPLRAGSNIMSAVALVLWFNRMWPDHQQTWKWLCKMSKFCTPQGLISKTDVKSLCKIHFQCTLMIFILFFSKLFSQERVNHWESNAQKALTLCLLNCFIEMFFQIMHRKGYSVCQANSNNKLQNLSII